MPEEIPLVTSFCKIDQLANQSNLELSENMRKAYPSPQSAKKIGDGENKKQPVFEIIETDRGQ